MAKILFSVPDDWKQPIDTESASKKKSMNEWLQDIVARVLKKKGYTLSTPPRRGRPRNPDEETSEQP